MQDYEKSFKDLNVLVAGGLGFIGSNLTHKLVSVGSRVTVVDSLFPECGGNVHNIRGIENEIVLDTTDVRNTEKMNSLVRNQALIFNLVGQISHVLSMKDPFQDLEINCRAHLSILEACRHTNPSLKIIYAGTRGQYGKTSLTPVSEDTILQPIDINGIHKTAGEMYHLLYYKIYGIKAVSLRLTNTFGPRHGMKSGDQSFLNWFVRLVLEKRTIPVFGDGSARRDFNYIDDVVDALLMSAVSDKSVGQIFNLGSNESYSILEVAKLLISIAGEGSFEFIPYPEERKSLEIGSYQGDFRKIRDVLGWNPNVSLSEGLHRTVQFYRENSKYYW